MVQRDVGEEEMYQDSIEFWDAGRDELYLYTENWDIAKQLKKEFRRCAVYMRGSQRSKAT